MGGLPERTPLEPQVTGTVSRSGYRVEKIIFQSQPKHYVTALLFLPESASVQAALSRRAHSVRPCRGRQGIRFLSEHGRPVGAQRHGGACLRSDRPRRARTILWRRRLAEAFGCRGPH